MDNKNYSWTFGVASFCIFAMVLIIAALAIHKACTPDYVEYIPQPKITSTFSVIDLKEFEGKYTATIETPEDYSFQSIYLIYEENEGLTFEWTMPQGKLIKIPLHIMVDQPQSILVEGHIPTYHGLSLSLSGELSIEGSSKGGTFELCEVSGLKILTQTFINFRKDR